MGNGASTTHADFSTLTTIHLPRACNISLEGTDAATAVIAGSSHPGLLLHGDVLVYVQGVRVMSCAHARWLFEPEARLGAPPKVGTPSDMLRVLVHRRPTTWVVLERPLAASPEEVSRFGLHLTSGGDPSIVGVTVLAFDSEGPAASLASSGTLVTGCEITHVDSEEVSSANHVSRLLRGVANGGRRTLTLRHVPRSKAFEPPTSVPRLGPINGDGKQSCTQLATARMDEFSPHPSPTGTTKDTAASVEAIEMMFV